MEFADDCLYIAKTLLELEWVFLDQNRAAMGCGPVDGAVSALLPYRLRETFARGRSRLSFLFLLLELTDAVRSHLAIVVGLLLDPLNGLIETVDQHEYAGEAAVDQHQKQTRLKSAHIFEGGMGQLLIAARLSEAADYFLIVEGVVGIGVEHAGLVEVLGVLEGDIDDALLASVVDADEVLVGGELPRHLVDAAPNKQRLLALLLEGPDGMLVDPDRFVEHKVAEPAQLHRGGGHGPAFLHSVGVEEQHHFLVNCQNQLIPELEVLLQVVLQNVVLAVGSYHVLGFAVVLDHLQPAEKGA